MRRRLLLVLLVFSVLAVAGFAVPLLESTAARRTQEYVLSRTGDLNRFATLAQEVTSGSDRTRLTGEVRGHTRVFGDGVVVVDARRRVIVEEGLRATEPRVSAAIDAALRNQPAATPQTLRPWSTGDVLLARPVGTGTRVSGAVVLRSTVDPAVEDITTSWSMILLGALAALTVCVVVVLRLAHWVLGPVRQLADGVHAVAAGRERAHVDIVAGPPELRGLAEEFNEMSDALAESAQRQRRLVADASHQLRNPMAALRLRIDTLAARDATHGPMVTEIERLEALLDGMLTLAAADSKATDLAADLAEEDHCDAVAVLAERAEAWHEAAVAKGVRLAGPTRVPHGIVVACAESELAQVVDVLLDNAIKYAGNGATARWSCVDEAGRVLLTIADDGPGVPAGELDRLTERFWRSGRHRDEPGSGLGLAIAERLVTARGGTFGVDNGDRGGLAVSVMLPTTEE
ncbi:HAMP domain-containing sensor histidine kinase [Actinophytocola oryzae]|uniref:histidine kinase n=1 Tax=Actinophytocola oryzae TaxID=502181 RepID=A0A4R7V1G9_9PSEU|nr:HAMP domain-containing sensor histidine kinase [Actinophytocola oryzae]TDV43143.1 signal transduction histidine kinase [Actinophytocola oryzae]